MQTFSSSNMKKIKITVIIIVLTFNLNAQLNTDLRIETGISLTITDFYSSISLQFNQPVLNYKIGINPSYTFLKFVSVKSGLNIQKTGFRKFELDTTLPNLSNFVVNYYYLEIPLLLYIKPFKKLSFYGGYSLKFLFLTNYNSTSIGKYIGNDFSAEKYVYDILLGVDYNISKKIKIGLNYFADRKQLQKDQYYSYRIYNQGILFSLNYNLF